MRNPLPFVFLVSAFSLSTAASAQISGYGGAGPRGPRPQPTVRIEAPALPDIGRQLDRIGDRIDAARRSGQISRGDTRQLRRETRRIDSLQERYGHDGLSPAEAREIENRALYLNDAVAVARSRPR